MQLTKLVDRFFGEESPVGNVIDDTLALALAIAATSFYSGYADLIEHASIPILDPAPDPPEPYPEITSVTDITVSEWALIRPLFLLYVERENAIQLESSRGMGIDVFGRSSSEISSDITQKEAEYPKKAFFHPIVTV